MGLCIAIPKMKVSVSASFREKCYQCVTPPQTAFKISHLDFMKPFAAISGHKHVT